MTLPPISSYDEKISSITIHVTKQGNSHFSAAMHVTAGNLALGVSNKHDWVFEQVFYNYFCDQVVPTVEKITTFF